MKQIQSDHNHMRKREREITGQKRRGREGAGDRQEGNVVTSYRVIRGLRQAGKLPFSNSSLGPFIHSFPHTFTKVHRESASILLGAGDTATQK